MKNKDSRTEINVNGTGISIMPNQVNGNDYICITDIAKQKSVDSDANDVIKNWLRNRDTIEFLGLWEKLNNPNFNPVEFDGFRKESGTNAFVLSPQRWIESTGAIGLISKAGRYGGTFAHKDIAFEFASWVSPEFKLYLIKEYQRLKDDENSRLSLDWNVNRTLAKINYRIHTDAIKDNLIPESLSKSQQGMTYASEAEVLNVALFGKTSKDWKIENSKPKGNIRDTATLEQLLVMANLESLNAELIRQGIPQNQRLLQLHKIARIQLQSLTNNTSVKKLKQ
ncbi:hypothetical protein SPSIL_058280 [Sporomusa silvacetica DSM 10669]|uniref:KilA-N domain-containing protein n=1 Tax=Sporomusa silvacetica DSM 10669 TaxID=1123289 RepID=A0ABZ3IV40_9FIRM|nr:KilA-N domain-containing protein [Sporomusa silvacetica]OZC14224.1 KilA-N domain protein [Sporomusa silvacetica DSM 10669]